MIGYMLELVQVLLALALAPGLVGFVRWVKARLQNRRGAPPWLPYFELTLTHEMDPKWAGFVERSRAGWAKMVGVLATTLTAAVP